MDGQERTSGRFGSPQDIAAVVAVVTALSALGGFLYDQIVTVRELRTVECRMKHDLVVIRTKVDLALTEVAVLNGLRQLADQRRRNQVDETAVARLEQTLISLDKEVIALRKAINQANRSLDCE